MGTKSVRNALVPVGRNPVDKAVQQADDQKGRHRDMPHRPSQPTPMYASPAKAVTAVPNNMTGFTSCTVCDSA